MEIRQVESAQDERKRLARIRKMRSEKARLEREIAELEKLLEQSKD